MTEATPVEVGCDESQLNPPAQNSATPPGGVESAHLGRRDESDLPQDAPGDACPYCGGSVVPNEPCPICARFWVIQELAKERGLIRRKPKPAKIARLPHND
jgi:hypothetical protein